MFSEANTVKGKDMAESFFSLKQNYNLVIS